MRQFLEVVIAVTAEYNYMYVLLIHMQQYQ